MITKFIFNVRRDNPSVVEIDVATSVDGTYMELLHWLKFSSPDDLRAQAKEFLDAHNALMYYAEKLEGD